jgi:hypothetical protein
VRKDSSFSEEKEAKRLLFSRCVALEVLPVTWAVEAPRNKSLFGSFSSEKERVLSA